MTVDQMRSEASPADAQIEAFIDSLPVPETLQAAILDRNAWARNASHLGEAQSYYRGLVRQIGEMLGDEAYTAEDGWRSDAVLCDKVPELVAKAIGKPLPPRVAA